MRTTSFRPLVATAMAVLAFSSAGMGAATAYAVPAPSDTTQVALDQSGNERSAVPTEDGLKLNTAVGDSVDIANNVATWRDQVGNVIASIDLDNGGNENVVFRYDEATQMIVAQTVHHGGVMTAACIPKWVAWAFNITWGALVCVPASAAASGIATPIAGIFTGSACAAAGGAMITAVSC